MGITVEEILSPKVGSIDTVQDLGLAKTPHLDLTGFLSSNYQPVEMTVVDRVQGSSPLFRPIGKGVLALASGAVEVASGIVGALAASESLFSGTTAGMYFSPAEQQMWAGQDPESEQARHDAVVQLALDIHNTATELKPTADTALGRFGIDLAAGIGSMAAFILPGLLTKRLATMAKVAPAVARFLGAGTAAVIESGVESGGVYRDLLVSGASRGIAEEGALKSFFANMALATATNYLGVFGEVGSTGKRILWSALMEGTQESTQDVIDRWAKKEPLLDMSAPTADVANYLRTGLIGAIIGGGAKTLIEAGNANTQSKIKTSGFNLTGDEAVDDASAKAYMAELVGDTPSAEMGPPKPEKAAEPVEKEKKEGSSPSDTILDAATEAAKDAEVRELKQAETLVKKPDPISPESIAEVSTNYVGSVGTPELFTSWPAASKRAGELANTTGLISKPVKVPGTKQFVLDIVEDQRIITRKDGVGFNATYAKTKANKLKAAGITTVPIQLSDDSFALEVKGYSKKAIKERLNYYKRQEQANTPKPVKTKKTTTESTKKAAETAKAKEKANKPKVKIRKKASIEKGKEKKNIGAAQIDSIMELQRQVMAADRVEQPDSTVINSDIAYEVIGQARSGIHGSMAEVIHAIEEQTGLSTQQASDLTTEAAKEWTAARAKLEAKLLKANRKGAKVEWILQEIESTLRVDRKAAARILKQVRAKRGKQAAAAIKKAEESENKIVDKRKQQMHADYIIEMLRQEMILTAEAGIAKLQAITNLTAKQADEMISDRLGVTTVRGTTFNSGLPLDADFIVWVERKLRRAQQVRDFKDIEQFLESIEVPKTIWADVMNNLDPRLVGAKVPEPTEAEVSAQINAVDAALGKASVKTLKGHVIRRAAMRDAKLLEEVHHKKGGMDLRLDKTPEQLRMELGEVTQYTDEELEEFGTKRLLQEAKANGILTSKRYDYKDTGFLNFVERVIGKKFNSVQEFQQGKSVTSKELRLLYRTMDGVQRINPDQLIDYGVYGAMPRHFSDMARFLNIHRVEQKLVKGSSRFNLLVPKRALERMGLGDLWWEAQEANHRANTASRIDDMRIRQAIKENGLRDTNEMWKRIAAYAYWRQADPKVDDPGAASIRRTLEAQGVADPTLTQEELGFYNFLRGLLEEKYEEIQEGRRKAGRDPLVYAQNYFTIFRDLTALQGEGDSAILTKTAKGVEKKLARARQTMFMHEKSRTMSTIPLDMRGKKVLYSYLLSANRYSNLTPALTHIQDLIAPYNLDTLPNKQVMDIDGNVHKGTYDLKFSNPELFEYINKWVNHIAGVKDKNVSDFERVVSRITSNTVGSYLLFNMTTIFSQFGAVGLVLTQVNPVTDFIPAVLSVTNLLLRDVVTGKAFKSERWLEGARAESSVLGSRSFDIMAYRFAKKLVDVHKLTGIKKAGGHIVNTYNDLFDHVMKVGMSFPAFTDEYTALIAWHSFANQAKRVAKSQGREISNKEIAKFADEWTIETQGSGDPVNRSAIQRDAYGRALTAMLTYAINEYGFFTDRILFKGVKKPSAIKRAKAMFAYLLATSALGAGYEEAWPWFIETSTGLKVDWHAPFPTPAWSLIKNLVEEGGMDKDVAINAVKDIFEIHPFTAAFRYGSSPLGAVVSTINKISLGASRGDVAKESFMRLVGWPVSAVKKIKKIIEEN